MMLRFTSSRPEAGTRGLVWTPGFVDTNLKIASFDGTCWVVRVAHGPEACVPLTGEVWWMPLTDLPPPLRFGTWEAMQAHQQWGFNCGPGALCALLSLTPSEIRPELGEFERRRYTNPTMMGETLTRLGKRWGRTRQEWPLTGVARIQWEGPWMDPKVPAAARYQHTHWVASWRFGEEPDAVAVYDLNHGYWVPVTQWRQVVVPSILQQHEPKATGWHVSHGYFVELGRST